MSDRNTYTVTVHKAAITLMKGESIAMYCATLKQAAREYIMKKFNIGKEGNAWPMEVYSNKAVFAVAPDMSKPPSNDFMVAVTYKRDDKGMFGFSDTMKVKAVTSFEPVDGVQLTKALDMDNWTPVDEEPVTKSLWGGVL